MSGLFDDDNDSKRTLGIRDKQILYRNANKRCQNPACGKEIDFDEMQVGHKTAWSRGGRTTLKNSVCLCWRCNKLQGTDSWTTFLKKQGIENKATTMKKPLDNLSISQLKSLAQKHNIKVKGSVEENFFDSYRKSPTKKQYISKLAGVVSQEEINSLPVEVVDIKKKKKRRSSNSWF
jgi:hypothetical protein